LPQGLKPVVYALFMERLKRLRKNECSRAKNPQKHPSGPEGHIHFLAFTARLKPCPFKASSFQQPVKPCPFKTVFMQPVLGTEKT
jgi:hypothetical protein